MEANQGMHYEDTKSWGFIIDLTDWHLHRAYISTERTKQAYVHNYL